VAKKSKTDLTASGKVTKAKTSGKFTASKAEKPVRPKKRVVKKVETKNEPVPAAALDLTDELIQTRAYFISERRRRFDLPGDANTDWLEAKRQLLAETRH
jgi:hypothetical protein